MIIKYLQLAQLNVSFRAVYSYTISKCRIKMLKYRQINYAGCLGD